MSPRSREGMSCKMLAVVSRISNARKYRISIVYKTSRTVLVKLFAYGCDETDWPCYRTRTPTRYSGLSHLKSK